MPVRDDEGVPVVLLLGVPVWLELGVPVWVELGVPVWLGLGVPVRLEEGVPVCDAEEVPVALALAVLVWLRELVTELEGVALGQMNNFSFRSCVIKLRSWGGLSLEDSTGPAQPQSPPP